MRPSAPAAIAGAPGREVKPRELTASAGLPKLAARTMAGIGARSGTGARQA
jgi:hypothetical protein